MTSHKTLSRATSPMAGTFCLRLGRLPYALILTAIATLNGFIGALL